MFRQAGDLRTLRSAGAVLGVCLALATTVRADNTPAFNAWWEKLTATGLRGPLPDGVKITYRVTEHPRLSDSELARLQAEAKDRPEHPGYGVLAAELESRRGLRPVDVSLWRIADEWRYSVTLSDGSYRDTVSANRASWTLTPKQLNIGSREAARGSRLLIDQIHGNVQFDIHALLQCGLPQTGLILIKKDASGASPANPLGTPTLAADGRSWRLSVSRQRPADGATLALEAKGEWDAQAGWGSIREVIHTERGGTQSSVIRFVSEGWRLEPSLGLGVAGRVETFYPDGRPNRSWEYLGLEPFTPQQFAHLIAEPTIDGTDPVRGRVTFSSVIDIRDPDIARTYMRPDPQAPTPVQQMPGSGTLRTLGWVVLSLLIVLFIIIKLRKTH